MRHPLVFAFRAARACVQYAGQRRLRDVEDVVPFCYGTVAWFIGKKARARARRATHTARTRRFA